MRSDRKQDIITTVASLPKSWLEGFQNTCALEAGMPVNRECAKRRASRWSIQLEIGFLLAVNSIVGAVKRSVAASVRALAAWEFTVLL